MNILTQTARRLQSVYPESEAKAMARIVLEDRFGLSQTDILLGKDSELSADDRTELENIVDRLIHEEPLQYVLGFTRFCGHRFTVRPGCLIPRPETEELVRLAERYEGNILDIGTGSGCIAISLALSGKEVTAWDISDEALLIARENAQSLGAKVSFEKKDILHIEGENRLWDIIVSNPPYVRQSEAKDMKANVLNHEPHLALFVPDADPLLFYRAIADFCLTHLKKGGFLLLEISQWLGSETAELLREKGFTEIKVLKDQFGINRMIQCTRL